MQRVLRIESLPDAAIEASAAFFADHLASARSLLEEASVSALAVVLPAAATDHDDWRRALAHDLARAHAPKRVNFVGGQGAGLDETLEFLSHSPGVTGQYCPLQG